MVSEIDMVKRQSGLLFVNKKKQKNFVNLEFVFTGLSAVGSDLIEQKFFAAFFQKRCFLPVLLVLIAAGIASPPPAQAHHSNSAYDRTRNETVAGTVIEFKWANPHTWLYLMVPDGKGGSDKWSFEGGSVSVLARNGWRASSIRPGQHVRVICQPNRNGSDGGGFIKVIFDDGSSLHIGVI